MRHAEEGHAFGRRGAAVLRRGGQDRQLPSTGDFAIECRPRVLANFGPPLLVETYRFCRWSAGGTVWTGDGKWSCSSSYVASTSSASAPSRVWRESLEFIGG